MKVILIFALFSLIVIQLNGQTIIGKIVDSSNAEPLVYASVGIIGTPIGTITDENGNFKINVTGQPLKAILRVSMISYKPETFTIEELSHKENTIKLISAPTQLAEVLIRPSGKLKEVGSSKTDSKIIGGWSGYQYGEGYESGLKIKLGTLPVRLMSLHIHVYKQSFDTSIFRLHVRSMANKKPSDELLSSNIFIAITKSSGLVDIDLSEYNLVFKGDIALMLEWVKVTGVNKDMLWQSKYSKVPVLVVFFKCSKQGNTYYKWGSENKWQVNKNMSPSIYLTVQE